MRCKLQNDHVISTVPTSMQTPPLLPSSLAPPCSLYKGTNCRRAAVPPPAPPVPSVKLQRRHFSLHLRPAGSACHTTIWKLNQPDKSYFHGKKNSKYRYVRASRFLFSLSLIQKNVLICK